MGNKVLNAANRGEGELVFMVTLKYLRLSLLLFPMLGFCCNKVTGEPVVSGDMWLFHLETGAVPVEFRVLLTPEAGAQRVDIVNGSEHIPVDSTRNEDRWLMEMPHYDSSIELQPAKGTYPWVGTWKKRRGQGKVAELVCKARPVRTWSQDSDPTAVAPPSASSEANKQAGRTPFLGRWSVKFADSDELAIGVFEASGEDAIEGTFLTTTGDYRYLYGDVREGQLYLSCFDGAHAFGFQAKLVGLGEEARLDGMFCSGDWYQVAWTATRDAVAKLPDAMTQTFVTDGRNLRQLAFPDLNGTLKKLGDSELLGEVTLIEIFGSWCPNCHDEAKYLKELRDRFGTRGLAVIGLAFELTGDFERDAKQVKRYVERHQVDYPVLIAGTSDKKLASETFPVLDRIRSYPTTLFLDHSGEIRAVYTGFSGPATGNEYQQLRTRFEQLIESLLREADAN